MSRLRQHLRANVVGYLGVFLALSSGAYAAGLAPNSVKSKHIVDGQVRGVDVADDSLDGWDIQGISGADLQSDTLTGGQVNESSLSAVPVAAQGGTGRYAFEGECNPETFENPLRFPWENCAFVPARLAKPGRVLIIGQVSARRDEGSDEQASGQCRLEINGAPIAASETHVQGEFSNSTLTAVSDVLPAGDPVIGIECREQNNLNTLDVRLARISAVTLSAN